MHPGKNIPTVRVVYCGQANLFWKAKFLFHIKDLLGKVNSGIYLRPMYRNLKVSQEYRRTIIDKEGNLTFEWNPVKPSVYQAWGLNARLIT